MKLVSKYDNPHSQCCGSPVPKLIPMKLVALVRCMQWFPENSGRGLVGLDSLRHRSCRSSRIAYAFGERRFRGLLGGREW